MARTHEEFVKIMSEINPNIEILGMYTKAQDRIAEEIAEIDTLITNLNSINVAL